MTTTTSLRPRRGLHPTFVLHDIRRQITPQNLIFTVALPAVLYLALFRVVEPSAGVDLPHGNFQAWMMIGIAVYGASIGTISRAAGISNEKANGWLRTIRLSPLGAGGYVASRIIACQVYAAIPVIVVGILGALTGARADAIVWITGLVVAWIGSAIFSALGLVLGMLLPPEVVTHVPGVVMTGLAFLGNIFIPLSGGMLAVAQVTPLYGVATLARYAQTDGYNLDGSHASLAGALINVAAWFFGFSFSAVRRFAGATGRQ
ncbi:ABC transporter permease [Rhodococcus sp. NPDC006774]|uniref:ABC transporter permease n=1 Tax=Rhodococcus sp. NPDC006774 TaxID=3157186 RepID=UPI0033F3CD3D